MLRGRALASSILAVLAFVPLSAAGQSVISTHSGVVHFFEGAVYLNDQLLESHLGKFPTIPQGGELRTAKGRAEVLLTPGVFLRVGEKTSIRLVANQLSDTRVELLAGSAVMDSEDPTSGTSVKLLYKNWSVHLLERGNYRINSDPAHLWVFQGRAEVAEVTGGKPGDELLLGRGMDVAFAATLVPSQTSERDHPGDGLSSWADGRRQSIAADNTIAANIQDPATLSISTSGDDSFTNFPVIGLPSVGPSSVYSSLGGYQPGFNSIYLPGYTYFPSYTLLPMLLGSSAYLSPYRPYYGGGVSIRPARSPIGSPIPVRPISPHPGPVLPAVPRPMPIRPVSPPGTHVGVRR